MHVCMYVCPSALHQVYNLEHDFDDFLDTIQRVQIRRSQARGHPLAASGRSSPALRSNAASVSPQLRALGGDTHREAEVRLLVLTNFAASKQLSAAQLKGLLRLYRASDARMMDAFDDSEDQESLLRALLALL